MSRQSVSPHDEGYSEENEESGSGQFKMDPEFGASSDAHHHYETMLPRDQEQHEYETMHHPSHSRHHHAHEDYIKMMPAFAGLTIPRPVVPSNYDVRPIPRPVIPSNFDIPPPFRRQNGVAGSIVSQSALKLQQFWSTPDDSRGSQDARATGTLRERARCVENKRRGCPLAFLSFDQLQTCDSSTLLPPPLPSNYKRNLSLFNRSRDWEANKIYTIITSHITSRSRFGSNCW